MSCLKYVEFQLSERPLLRKVSFFLKNVLQVPVNNGVWILLFRDKLRNADQKLIVTERVPETRWKVHVLCIIYLLCVFVWCGMWKSESYLRRQLGRTYSTICGTTRTACHLTDVMVEPGSKKILRTKIPVIVLLSQLTVNRLRMRRNDSVCHSVLYDSIRHVE